MKPTVEAYTVALPWYGREGYQLLWDLVHDRDEMPCDYEGIGFNCDSSYS